MIYRFRVILDNDTEEDIFRDLEIRETDSLEDLHNVIAQSFGFDGMEMASFYISDEKWNQGEEISMFDMGDSPGSERVMSNTQITEVVHEVSPRLIYVYDFLSMWTFFVELAEIVAESNSTDYPNLMFVHGQLPDAAPTKEFKAEDSSLDSDYEDDSLDFEN
ncbi:MAG: hypothetical protein AAGH46_06535, partial [Bacteroidota bacterium]